MANPTNQNQGEGDRTSDQKYRDDIKKFLKENDPEALAKKAASELDDEQAKRVRPFKKQSGKIGWAILWLLGIPLPVLLLIYLIRGH